LDKGGRDKGEMIIYWAVVGTPIPRKTQAIMVKGRAR